MGRGLTTEESLAVMSLEHFGLVRDPKQARWSEHPKLGNFIYKEMLRKPDCLGPDWQKALEHHNEIITQFAEDKKVYNANLKSGFVKMCDWGSDAT